MRLLSTKTLEVALISEDEIPPYAILSHTWEKDEVTLQDMQGFGARLMSTASRVNLLSASHGLQKVLDAAKLAASEGYDWIWIDTCCIDKTSSAELSEAINSMYRWYQNSEVCYVYLADALAEVRWSKPDNDIVIQKSRWITRGWTLQELIAPSTLSFYSKEWSFLGRRNDEKIMRALAKATGIDIGVLSGDIATHEVSLANRLRWASKRKTRRQEDMAYCLMGLFGVNMPLLYGEGAVRSFTRLQNEILQATDDQTIFAWSTPPGQNQATGLLAESPEYFRHALSMYPISGWHQPESSVPWTMTNRGLMVQLHLQPCKSIIREEDDSTDEVLAILDCSAEVKRLDHYGREWIHEYSPAILLRRLWGDQYARLHRERGLVYVKMRDRQGGEVRTLFVKQDQSLPLPSFTIAENLLRGTGTFILSQVYPRDLWDSKSGIFRSGLSRQRCIQGLFRFCYPVGSGDSEATFDVAVALQSTRSGEFQPVVMLRPSENRTTRQSYDHINKIWVATPSGGKSKLVKEYQENMIAVLQLRGTQRLGGVSYILELVARAELENTESDPLVNSRSSTVMRGLSLSSACQSVEERLRLLFKPICVTEPSHPSHLTSLDKRIRVRCRNELPLDINSALRAAAVTNTLALSSTTKTLPKAVDFDGTSNANTSCKVVGDSDRHSMEDLDSVHDQIMAAIEKGDKVREQQFNRIILNLFQSADDADWDDFNVKDEWRYLFRLQNGNGETVLHRAAAMSNFEVVSYICEHAPYAACYLDSMSRSTLFHAACGGDARVVSVIATTLKSLVCAPTIDYPDDNGLTPLHVACREGHLGCVKVLLDLGASLLCATQSAGLTPVHYVLLFDHCDCLMAIAKHRRARKDLDFSRGGAETEALIPPIHLAAANGCAQCVKILIYFGSPRTSLASTMCFTRQQSSNSLHGMTKDRGPDTMDETIVQVQEIQSSTPEEVANRKGWSEVVEYLRTVGSDLLVEYLPEEYFHREISVLSLEEPSTIDLFEDDVNSSH